MPESWRGSRLPWPFMNAMRGGKIGERGKHTHTKKGHRGWNTWEGISGLHYRWLIAGVAGHQFSSVMIFHFGCWCPSLLLSQTICLCPKWEHLDSHKSVPSPLSADVPLALILMKCFFFASLEWMFGLSYVQALLIALHTRHCVVFTLIWQATLRTTSKMTASQG